MKFFYIKFDLDFLNIDIYFFFEKMLTIFALFGLLSWISVSSELPIDGSNHFESKVYNFSYI